MEVKDVEGRKLPEVEIAGVKFLADAISGEFIEASNPKNTISIYEMMIFDTHYEMLFDKRTNQPYEGRWDEAERDKDLEYVRLRTLQELDPEGMDILLKQNKVVWIELDGLSLPKVKIHDAEFYIDPLRKGLRDVDNKWNVIRFTDMVPNKGGQHEIYYDTKCRNVSLDIDINNPPTPLPGHIVRVKVPKDEFNIVCKKVMAEWVAEKQAISGTSEAKRNKKMGL
ncbi:hypothetical protein [Olivibacter domesticus]|uniref:Uncharacterized protein n=1 Tax=Olivibacter domesticus TaxID=407022 RepID=A0A1H7IEH9_OLID1|nr:hypothetical protein [Olivibacter domesticus]SEK59035.1 hypothetical protein SAMN05661044_00625 [Olivibacter domesticus]